MDSLVLLVKRLSENATLPSRGTELSAGYDLSSAHETTIPARGTILVKTDLSVKIPEGHYGRIGSLLLMFPIFCVFECTYPFSLSLSLPTLTKAPRSGLALKHSLDVGAGVIDQDYRGNVCVVMFNHSDIDFKVAIGDRIAQLILEKNSTPQGQSCVFFPSFKNSRKISFFVFF